MSARFKFLKSDFPATAALLVSLGISQLACGQAEHQSNSAAVEQATADRDLRLSHNEISDPAALIRQHRTGSPREIEIASSILKASREEFDKNRFTVAGQGFVESASVYPTVEALVFAAECLNRLDMNDQPNNSRVQLKRDQAKRSFEILDAAKKFAAETNQVSDLEKFTNVDVSLDCLRNQVKGESSGGECKILNSH